MEYLLLALALLGVGASVGVLWLLWWLVLPTTREAVRRATPIEIEPLAPIVPVADYGKLPPLFSHKLDHAHDWHYWTGEHAQGWERMVYRCEGCDVRIVYQEPIAREDTPTVSVYKGRQPNKDD